MREENPRCNFIATNQKICIPKKFRISKTFYLMDYFYQAESDKHNDLFVVIPSQQSEYIGCLRFINITFSDSLRDFLPIQKINKIL